MKNLAIQPWSDQAQSQASPTDANVRVYVKQARKGGLTFLWVDVHVDQSGDVASGGAASDSKTDAKTEASADIDATADVSGLPGG
jgi:hypothetical protein